MEPGIKKERPPGGAKLQTAKSGTETGNTVGMTRSWTNQETEGVILVSRGGRRTVQDLYGKVPLGAAQLLMGIMVEVLSLSREEGLCVVAEHWKCPEGRDMLTKATREWPHR